MSVQARAKAATMQREVDRDEMCWSALVVIRVPMFVIPSSKTEASSEVGICNL